VEGSWDAAYHSETILWLSTFGGGLVCATLRCGVCFPQAQAGRLGFVIPTLLSCGYFVNVRELNIEVGEVLSVSDVGELALEGDGTQLLACRKAYTRRSAARTG
jgi:hypothetical protein